jgi:hypothetical protein
MFGRCTSFRRRPDAHIMAKSPAGNAGPASEQRESGIAVTIEAVVSNGTLFDIQSEASVAAHES